MTRLPADVDVKRDQHHKDVGKPAADAITAADLAADKAKAGGHAKPAQLVETVKKWKHPIKGNR